MDRERILVLGDYRQTVTVVRSLARAGHEVVLGTEDPRSATAWSRHVARTWTCPAPGSGRYAAAVEGWLRREGAAFVFTVGESQLRALLPHARRLQDLSAWVAPAWPVLVRCFNKRAMFELCDALGVPTRPWAAWKQGGAAHWRAHAAAHGFPVVVKRCDSAGQVAGRKALILEDAAQLDRFCAQAGRDPDRSALLLQQYAPGVRHNCHFAADAGELVTYFQQAVVRTDMPDGTGIGIEGISVAPDAQLRQWCRAITRALGYHGIGCIQFLVDDAGAVSFLELNARMDSTAALPLRLGYDFPRLAVALARRRRSGTAVDAPVAAYPAGRRYHWLYGDLLAWHDAHKAGTLEARALAAWALRSAGIALTSHHLTWDWRDPLPTLSEYGKQVRNLLARRTGLQLAPGFR